MSPPQPQQSASQERGFFSELWKKLTLGAIVGGIAIELATKSISPWAVDSFDYYYDSWSCGGRAAMAEADRLSDQASTEPAQAIDYLRAANPLYEKAYACGFSDAGIRLAVAHCMGLGTKKNPAKARQLILEIEGKYANKAGRAGDARKACGL